MIFIAKSITGFYFFKTNRRTNITGFDKINRVLFVGKHFHDTADTFFLTTSYIQYIRTCIKMT